MEIAIIMRYRTSLVGLLVGARMFYGLVLGKSTLRVISDELSLKHYHLIGLTTNNEVAGSIPSGQSSSSAVAP